MVLTGIAIVAGIAFLCCLASLVVGDPYKVSMDERLSPPSLKHPFGTDQLGRDMLSRVLHGGRVSLVIAATISLLSMCIGSLIGAVSGYFGGVVDDAIGRIIDVFMSIPEIVLNIAMVGVFCAAYGASTLIVIAAVVFTNWVGYARVMRGMVLSLKEREFVLCARAIGAGDWYILFRHVIPNAASPLVVLATLNVGNVIMTIASLGFLGLGIQPPTPEWGQILNSGKNYITTAPWITFFPGLFIALSVFGFNLLGEGLNAKHAEG
ncbi:MAG: peptide/nickel transport system permease protein [Archaeoglobus sp.]|nr:peptide/nickel transport system permease protein [Archaeoglobus sp.]